MTLFIVQAPGREAPAILRANFIKDGFTWGGFAFGWLWLAYHRLWVASAIYLVVEILVFVLVRPHVELEALLLLDLLARFLVGLEGNRLRETKGARAAAINEIVEARDRADAETIFYARHAGGAT